MSESGQFRRIEAVSSESGSLPIFTELLRCSGRGGGYDPDAELLCSSGQFVTIDDRRCFQLMPWQPARERHVSGEFSGVAMPGGDDRWSFVRERELGL